MFFSATTPTTGKELFKYIDPTTLSINTSGHESNILLFPNPVTNSFTIQSIYYINSIDVIDIQGKIIKSFDNSSESL